MIHKPQLVTDWLPGTFLRVANERRIYEYPFMWLVGYDVWQTHDGTEYTIYFEITLKAFTRFGSRIISAGWK